MGGDKREWLTVREVAEMCGVSPRTVRRWVWRGVFPGAAKGMGRTSPYRIPRREVESLLQAGRVDL